MVTASPDGQCQTSLLPDGCRALCSLLDSPYYPKVVGGCQCHCRFPLQYHGSQGTQSSLIKSSCGDLLEVLLMYLNLTCHTSGWKCHSQNKADLQSAPQPHLHSESLAKSKSLLLSELAAAKQMLNKILRVTNFHRKCVLHLKMYKLGKTQVLK